MTIRRTRRIAAAITVAAAVAGGCGKKGAPLAPFVRIPAAVEKMAVARFGDEIYVTLTVPSVNIDKSVPVDIARVEVYGYTGATAPGSTRWVELGTLVATIPVSPPPVVPAGDAAPSDDLGPAFALPGTAVTVLDFLEEDELVQGRMAAVDPRLPSLVPPGPETPAALRRFYIAIPFSQRDEPGPPGQQAEVTLAAVPEPPTDVRTTYDPTAVSLTWEPSGGLLGFLLERSLPREPVPFGAEELTPQASDTSGPLGPTTYQIYREVFGDPFEQPAEVPSPSWQVALPVALNPKPVPVTTFRDAVEFGRRRCYTVRAQRGGVLSEASRPACVTPIDTFPPSSPVGLTAVPSEGAINLIWEPNTENDLGGYLVLRKGPGDATLRPLDSVPVGNARYRDTTVESGSPYVYAVVAVDTQAPRPNASMPSAPVEEVAR